MPAQGVNPKDVVMNNEARFAIVPIEIDWLEASILQTVDVF